MFGDAVDDIERPTPFAPGNPIVFATGPLAGARVCGSTRVNVVSLSPETTGIFTSQGGGEFGPDIKRAGFDALVITGASATPVYLDIQNDRVAFADATALWGLDRRQAFDRLNAMGRETSPSPPSGRREKTRSATPTSCSSRTTTPAAADWGR